MLIVDGNDLTQIACNIKYTDQLNNGASSLTWEYPIALAKFYPEGATVIFKYGSTNVFYGFLFTSRADIMTVKCTAYDQLRYFKAQDFMHRTGEPLDAFVKRICGTISDRISIGTMTATGAKLSAKIFDNKTYLDMFYDSIKETLLLSGNYYALRDEFGALTLRDVYDLRLGLVVGDGSLATDYDYVRSIDEDTFNVVKVGQDNKATGQRDTIVVKDGESVTKWGKLMHYQTFNDRNDAQLKGLAAAILAVKNRPTEALSIDCVGDLRVRAGVGLKIKISDIGVDLWAIVTQASHSFSGAEHTMRLNLQYGRWLGWMR